MLKLFEVNSNKIEKSTCCNAEVEYSKGSYMGQWHKVCTQCDKYCKIR